MNTVEGRYPDQAPHLATGFFFTALVLVVSIVVVQLTAGTLVAVLTGAVGVAVSLGVFWVLIAQPSVEAIALSRASAERSSADVAGLQTEIDSVSADRERGERKLQRLGGILAATQHELNREITMLGFAVDDLVDASEEDGVTDAEIEQLKVALNHVEEGQRNVSALSRLGTSDSTDRIAKFTASDIAPLTIEADMVIERDDAIYGDVDLWRLFAKNAARNSEAHGKAKAITISSGDGRLTIADDGSGCATEDLQQSWKSALRPNGTRSDGTQIMRRIAEAHSAFVTMQGEVGKGVRIIVDLRDLEIDLRDRGVITASVGTPHKASGGRVMPTPVASPTGVATSSLQE